MKIPIPAELPPRHRVRSQRLARTAGDPGVPNFVRCGGLAAHHRSARQQHTLETGQRFGQIGRRHTVREDSAKPAWIFAVGLQAPNRFCDHGTNALRDGT